MWNLLASLADGSSLNQWIQETYWLWPVMEIIHFIGLVLLLGGLIVVDLRMAGHLRVIKPNASHQLLPFVIAGFVLNLVTGTLFFVGDPGRYSINIGFQIKMVLVGLAGLNALFYHLKVSPIMSNWDHEADSPLLAKCVAYTSLTVWTGVLLTGRLIPYVGTG
jgi:hypothetical protein